MPNLGRRPTLSGKPSPRGKNPAGADGWPDRDLRAGRQGGNKPTHVTGVLIPHEDVVGVSVAGIDPDSVPVLGHGCFALALGRQRAPEVVVGHRVHRLQLNGLAVLSYRRSQFALSVQENREVKDRNTKTTGMTRE